MLTNNLQLQYENLKKEVACYRDKVLTLLPKDSREYDLYKGTAILYSELLYKPKFMFIGINPGSGFYKHTGKKQTDDELEPNDCFEYIMAEEDGYDYLLAKQTRYIFCNTKYAEEFRKSVKTNVFYTSTDCSDDLNEFYTILNEKYQLDMWQLSFKWTKQMIEIFQPEIIICEGVTVVYRLEDIFDCKLEKEGNIARGYVNGIKVIGYKRCRSNICDKDSVISCINDL